MLYRYEVYVDNEYQGVGIFHCLGELELDEDFENQLLRHFEVELPFIPMEQRCEFLFTEKGQERFGNDIEKILKIFDDDSLFEARCLKVDGVRIPLENIIYRDAYQIAVIPETLETIRRENMGNAHK